MKASNLTLRRWLEHLLGQQLVAYLLHLRPLEWPIMTAHFLLGTLLASGLRLPLKTLGMGWFVFVVLLNAGTLALNSAFDRDEGDIGYLRNPPKPPKYLLQLSIGMLATSFCLGFYLPRLFNEVNILCIAMALFYSIPPIRLKARAGWDAFINCLGFGLLTPLAGWGLTGRPITSSFWNLTFGFFFLFGALYPMTQIYQVEEDQKRGDQTLVIRLGIKRALAYATGSAIVAHLYFALALLKAHRNPLLLALSFLAWMAVLLPWLKQWRQWNPKQHEKGMYRGLLAWAITDVSMLLLLWSH